MRGPRDEVPGGDPRIHVAPLGTSPAAGVDGLDTPGHDGLYTSALILHDPS
jgi:hypothetical protein